MSGLIYLSHWVRLRDTHIGAPGPQANPAKAPPAMPHISLENNILNRNYNLIKRPTEKR